MICSSGQDEFRTALTREDGDVYFFSLMQDLKPGERPMSLTPHALQFIAVGLLAVGLMILFYAIYIYNERVRALTKKEVLSNPPSSPLIVPR